MSVRLAALSTRLKGAPRRSLSRWRLVPSFPRLVGSDPVSSPPRGGRHRGAVGALAVPPDPVRPIVASELLGPEPPPHPTPGPLLKARMDGGPGAELPGDRLPLAAGAQHMQDAIEHPTKWHRRPTTGPRRFLRRQDLLADRPQVVRHPPERRRRTRIIVARHRAPPL